MESITTYKGVEMESITVGELVKKVQELDMYFFEAGFERTDDIRFD